MLQKLTQINAYYKSTLADQQFDKAIEWAKKALKMVPNHPQILGDLAYANLQNQSYQHAYDGYSAAIKHSPAIDTNLYDGLTHSCWVLGKVEEAKRNGLIALQSKKEQVKNNIALTIPAGTPPPLSVDKTQNIISFSLFGDNPRYCETAILNVDLAKDLYPQWTCRFYCDESVPKHVRERLTNRSAQVLLVSDDIKTKLSGLMWRFLVLDDPSVMRFMCRDADSLFSTREQYAVNEWLASDKWFHVMRDYAYHTELILAGMWGGCTGVFKNLFEMMQQFIASGIFLSPRVMDQHFLRHNIWPTIQQSLYHHDGFFSMPESERFPLHPQHLEFEKYPDFHVGANVANSKVCQKSIYPDGIKLSWSIMDEHNDIICSYQETVKQGQILINLPGPYANRLLAKEWSITIDTP